MKDLGQRGSDRLTQADIIEVAIRVFHQRGYHRATLEEVAAELGVSRPAIYYHFSSKEDLLAEIQRVALQKLLSGAEPIFAADEPVRTKFARLLENHIASIAANKALLSILYEESKRVKTPIATMVEALRDEYTRRLEELYRQGVAEGSFVDEDPALVVHTLFGAANWVYQWFRPEGRYDPGVLAQRMARLLCMGYCRPRCEHPVDH